jgi:hypothetical protein
MPWYGRFELTASLTEVDGAMAGLLCSLNETCQSSKEVFITQMVSAHFAWSRAQNGKPEKNR